MLLLVLITSILKCLKLSKALKVYSYSSFNLNVLGKELREKVKELVNHLEDYDRTYFGKDRHKQIKARIDEITALLDTEPIEFGTLHFKFMRYDSLE